MNPQIVYPTASANNKNNPQEHSPVATETFLSRRSAKTLFALVVCPVLALLGFSDPASALAITSVVPSKGIVTVNWRPDTTPPPYQVEKTTDLINWEPVDMET